MLTHAVPLLDVKSWCVVCCWCD